MVWKAYLQVRRNGKSAGVDHLSMSEYDKERSKHLYKVWNRLSSGSYCVGSPISTASSTS